MTLGRIYLVRIVTTFVCLQKTLIFYRILDTLHVIFSMFLFLILTPSLTAFPVCHALYFYLVRICLPVLASEKMFIWIRSLDLGIL